MSENALANIQPGMLSTQLGADKDFDTLGARDFIGRLKLYTKGDAVTNGAISPGHFGVPLSRTEIEIDLGKSIDILLLARRAEAQDWSGNNPVFSYHFDSPLFQQIKDACDEYSGDENPYRYGVSFLIYERSSKRCLTWYLSGKREKGELNTLYPYLPKDDNGPTPVTVTGRMKGKKFPSYVPTVSRCSTPFDDVPTDRLVVEIQKFVNVTDTDVEAVDESNQRAR